MSRLLDVYLQENLVGNLEQNASGDLKFTYNPDYISVANHALSISLPLQEAPFSDSRVKAFFSGLLPEEKVREKLAHYLGLSEKNSFALLEAIGGDCAGAIALYPHGTKPNNTQEDKNTLDNDQLRDVLERIKRRPMLAGDDGYRLSLAGAQNKLAIRFDHNKVHLMKGGAPTTHILKPIIDYVEDSAHNEFFCMKLAALMGIDVPNVSLHFVDNTPYYLVERYDRYIDEDKRIGRIHQEDFCQALGIPPEMKYEREGGPTISACLEIITKNSIRPASDQIKFLNMVIFNYLIGNADAHGKNFSLLYKEKKPELAPAYDLLCTAIYPDLSAKMAMKIGGKYKPDDVCLRHFYKLVPDTKTAQSSIQRQITTMAQKIMGKATTLKTDLQNNGLTSEVFDMIIQVIKERSARF